MPTSEKSLQLSRSDGRIADDPEENLRYLILSFNGRLKRRPFWLYGVLGVLLAQFFATALLGIAGFAANTADTVATALVAWPSLAITAKRWHDRGRSAWWMLIMLIPVIGLLWTLIECGLLRGEAGANRFGPAPSGAS
jgi:uncharacterized membrane protein YhaH (DUF805 family)